MKLGIKGKKVVITGASQGIGLEIAKLFSLEGASVTIISSNKKKLNKALRAVKKSSKKTKYMANGINITNHLVYIIRINMFYIYV